MDCSPALELLAFSADLHLFAGLAQKIFRTLKGEAIVGDIPFDDEDAKDSSQRTDFKLMRSAGQRRIWSGERR